MQLLRMTGYFIRNAWYKKNKRKKEFLTLGVICFPETYINIDVIKEIDDCSLIAKLESHD